MVVSCSMVIRSICRFAGSGIQNGTAFLPARGPVDFARSRDFGGSVGAKTPVACGATGTAGNAALRFDRVMRKPPTCITILHDNTLYSGGKSLSGAFPRL